jgi:hypothetical protein
VRLWIGKLVGLRGDWKRGTEKQVLTGQQTGYRVFGKAYAMLLDICIYRLFVSPKYEARLSSEQVLSERLHFSEWPLCFPNVTLP